jgi:hypothetical protein
MPATIYFNEINRGLLVILVCIDPSFKRKPNLGWHAGPRFIAPLVANRARAGARRCRWQGSLYMVGFARCDDAAQSEGCYWIATWFNSASTQVTETVLGHADQQTPNMHVPMTAKTESTPILVTEQRIIPGRW